MPGTPLSSRDRDEIAHALIENRDVNWAQQPRIGALINAEGGLAPVDSPSRASCEPGSKPSCAWVVRRSRSSSTWTPKRSPVVRVPSRSTSPSTTAGCALLDWPHLEL